MTERVIPEVNSRRTFFTYAIHPPSRAFPFSESDPAFDVLHMEFEFQQWALDVPKDEAKRSKSWQEQSMPPFHRIRWYEVKCLKCGKEGLGLARREASLSGADWCFRVLDWEIVEDHANQCAFGPSERDRFFDPRERADIRGLDAPELPDVMITKKNLKKWHERIELYCRAHIESDCVVKRRDVEPQFYSWTKKYAAPPPDYGFGTMSPPMPFFAPADAMEKAFDELMKPKPAEKPVDLTKFADRPEGRFFVRSCVECLETWDHRATIRNNKPHWLAADLEPRKQWETRHRVEKHGEVEPEPTDPFLEALLHFARTGRRP